MIRPLPRNARLVPLTIAAVIAITAAGCGDDAESGEPSGEEMTDEPADDEMTDDSMDEEMTDEPAEDESMQDESDDMDEGMDGADA